MRRCVLIAAALLASPSAQALEVPCREILMPTLAAFQAHTESHIRRVTILGMEMHRKFAADFPLVQAHLLAEFLTLHDQSKVNRTAPFLRKHALDGRAEPIIATLFQHSGHWDQWPEAEKSALRNLMNRVDHQVALAFFLRNGLIHVDGSLSEAAQQYLHIEKVVDSVDTVLSVARGEEFGKFPRIGLDQMHVSQEGDWVYVRYLARHYRRRVKDRGDHLFLGRQGFEP